MTELPVTLYGTHLGELVRAQDRALLRWSPEAEERFGVNSHSAQPGPPGRTLTRPGRPSRSSAACFPRAPTSTASPPQRRWRATTSSACWPRSAPISRARSRSAARVSTPSREMLSPAEVGALLDRADGYLVGGGGSAVPGVQRKLTLTRDRRTVDARQRLGRIHPHSQADSARRTLVGRRRGLPAARRRRARARAIRDPRRA